MVMKISIGIPAYNEQESLPFSIQTIQAQKNIHEHELEIIVCLNGCTDKSETTIKKLIKEDKRILVLSTTVRGKAIANNEIIKKAGGEILIFMDADVLLKSDAVFELINSFSEKVKLVGAISLPVISFNENSILGRIGKKQALKRYNNPNKYVVGAFYGLKDYKKIIFPENIINEDRFLSMQFSPDEKKINQKAAVYYFAPATYRDKFLQEFRVKLGRLQQNAILFPPGKKIINLSDLKAIKTPIEFVDYFVEINFNLWTGAAAKIAILFLSSKGLRNWPKIKSTKLSQEKYKLFRLTENRPLQS